MRHYLMGYLLLIVSGAALVIGCAPLDPHLGQYTYTKPTQADLIGVWAPDIATLDDIHTRGNYKVTNHQIILRADGTFWMTNMPDWTWNDGNSWKTFKSGPGKWSISKSSPWGVDFNSTNTAKIADSHAVLFNNKPPYNLIFILGDVDSDHIMMFKRLKQ